VREFSTKKKLCEVFSAGFFQRFFVLRKIHVTPFEKRKNDLSCAHEIFVCALHFFRSVFFRLQKKQNRFVGGKGNAF
jgi:hypothetical protein